MQASKQLTKRQKEVLRLTRRGMKPRQISERLGVGVNAVYAHMSRLRASGHLESKKAAAPEPPAKEAKTLNGTVEQAAELCRQFVAEADARKDEILKEIEALRAEYGSVEHEAARAKALIKAVEG
jgi:DNA-binding CsgD family transcriptional regulator